MKIIELRAENFKRLKAVSIRPDENNLVMVTGKNAQGKTSALDAIWAALDGRAIQPKPIREGEDKAEINLDLGDYKVKRAFSPKGNYLTVTDATGKSKFNSPQTLVNRFLGDLTFDPLEFLRMDAKKQTEILKKLVKIELLPQETGVFDEDLREKAMAADPSLVLDCQRERTYSERTLVNRELANLRAQLEGMPDVPQTERVNVADLLEKKATLEKAVTTWREWEMRRTVVNDTAQGIVALRDGLKGKEPEKFSEVDIRQVEEQVETLIDELAQMRKGKAEHDAWERDTQDAARKFQEAIRAVAELDARKPPVPDVTEFEKLNMDIATSANQNAQAEAYERRKSLYDQAKTKKEVSDKLSRQIEDVDRIKGEMLARANMPVAGLEFCNEGIKYNGIPLSQCSSAEQLRISCAIAMSVNPDLRVMLIRDGSLLDSQNMKTIQEMAVEHDFQVWMEKVDETGEIGFYIENGEVK